MSDSDDEEKGGVETLGRIKQRHKRELKEFETKSKEMLHSTNKKDKNAKKECQSKIDKLELELKARHEKEIKAKQMEDEKEQLQSAMEELKLQTEEQNRRAALKSEKKEAEAVLARQRQSEVVASLADRVDLRHVENTQLHLALQPHGLCVHEILSDGNCLYRAIGHQLALLRSAMPTDFASLRALAASHMRQHPADFMPYLTTDDGEMLSHAGFEVYLADVMDADKAVWGGEPEIAALSAALQLPVTIHHAGQKPRVLGLMAGHDSGERLQISFHKHYYGLGAHYNSIVPIA